MVAGLNPSLNVSAPWHSAPVGEDYIYFSEFAQ